MISDTLGTGFEEGPGGPLYNDRQAYSYHVRTVRTFDVPAGNGFNLISTCLVQLYCGPTDRDGNPTNVIKCNEDDSIYYAIYNETIRRLGGGYFMTELGAMANTSESMGNLNFITGRADAYLSSWSYWQFKSTVIAFLLGIISHAPVGCIQVSTTSRHSPTPWPSRSTLRTASWK
jgi:hypothetical protein